MTISLDSMVRGEAFRRDTRRLLEIPDDLFEQANAMLEVASGSAGQDRVKALLGEVLLDETQRDGFIAFLLNLTDFKRSFELETDFLVDETLRRASSNVSEADAGRLAARLRRVLVEKPCLTRKANVDRVAERTGAHLDHLSLTSDLRPVFDDDRNRIESMVPLTTLKVVAHAADGITAVEVRLTEAELEELSVEVQMAKKKLAMLKDLVRKQTDIELPQTDVLESEAT